MLKIHVLNVNHGDSIVIEFPNGEWGLIDSNKVDNSIPALDFLISRDVKKLAFLCITHPHADHYAGMSSIINHFQNRIEEVWLFDLDSIRLREYLKQIQETIETPIAHENFSELTKIARLLFSKSHKITTNIQFLRGIMDLRTVGGVTIRCLAPLGKQYSKYLSYISSPKKEDSNNIDENLISSIIELEYNGAKVLLGGDAPLESWEALHKKMLNDNKTLSANLVKISHHGSISAFSDKMWSNIANEKTVAAISVGNKYGLPNDQVLKGIKKFGSNIYCTNKGLNCYRTDIGDISTLYGDIPHKAKIALLFQDKTPQHPLKKCMGDCTFSIDATSVTVKPEIPYLCLHNFKTAAPR